MNTEKKNKKARQKLVEFFRAAIRGLLAHKRALLVFVVLVITATK